MANNQKYPYDFLEEIRKIRENLYSELRRCLINDERRWMGFLSQFIRKPHFTQHVGTPSLSLLQSLSIYPREVFHAA